MVSVLPAEHLCSYIALLRPKRSFHGTRWEGMGELSTTKCCERWESVGFWKVNNSFILTQMFLEVEMGFRMVSEKGKILHHLWKFQAFLRFKFPGPSCRHQEAGPSLRVRRFGSKVEAGLPLELDRWTQRRWRFSNHWFLWFSLLKSIWHVGNLTQKFGNLEWRHWNLADKIRVFFVNSRPVWSSIKVLFGIKPRFGKFTTWYNWSFKYPSMKWLSMDKLLHLIRESFLSISPNETCRNF